MMGFVHALNVVTVLVMPGIGPVLVMLRCFLTFLNALMMLDFPVFGNPATIIKVPTDLNFAGYFSFKFEKNEKMLSFMGWNVQLMIFIFF